MKIQRKTTSFCSYYFFSLSLVLTCKFSRFPLLLTLSSFYPPSLLLFQLCPSQLDLERYLSHQTPPCHFLIMKVDFWSVFIIQASHSAFNEANIRQEQLINVEVTVTLDYALSFSHSQGIGTETKSLVNHLTTSQLGYYLSG